MTYDPKKDQPLETDLAKADIWELAQKDDEYCKNASYIQESRGKHVHDGEENRSYKKI